MNSEEPALSTSTHLPVLITAIVKDLQKIDFFMCSKQNHQSREDNKTAVALFCHN